LGQLELLTFIRNGPKLDPDADEVEKSDAANPAKQNAKV
jgi:hypothetical protein